MGAKEGREGLRFVTVQGVGEGGWCLGEGNGVGKAEADLLVWSSERRLKHKIRPGD